MKIQISLSALYTGITELPTIKDGEPIPLAKVRMRQAVLARRATTLGADIQFHARQADMDFVKELREEIKNLTTQISVLKRVRTQCDRQLYVEYTDVYNKQK